MWIPLLLACTDAVATWEVGADLSALDVLLIAPDEGVHPSPSVLADPTNPFDARVLDVKWEILASDCAPGFYAFATALAVQPTGEGCVITELDIAALHQRRLQLPAVL